MRLGLAPEVIEIIDYANNYHLDKKEFIKNSDRSSEFASIIVASQIFNMRELGLFSRKFSINHIIDELYSLVMINEMKKDVIDALAKGLRQNKLFDFYGGLDEIKKRCLLGKPEKYPLPYPMIGFKSPIVILCKGRIKKCPAINPSQSVTIFKNRGGLKEGSYNVCNLLNKGLKDLYKDYYGDIKEVTTIKALDETDEKNR